jgi:hypothetical protein
LETNETLERLATGNLRRRTGTFVFAERDLNLGALEALQRQPDLRESPPQPSLIRSRNVLRQIV